MMDAMCNTGREYLTSDEFDEISNLTVEDGLKKTIWLATANGIIGRFSLDEGAPFFCEAMKLAATCIIESLSAQSGADVIMASNRPFQSERMASYAYSRGSVQQVNIRQQELSGILAALPEKARFLIELYQKGIGRSIQTQVFYEFPPNEDGLRKWNELLDQILEEFENANILSYANR